jgi:hypothetical protein
MEEPEPLPDEPSLDQTIILGSGGLRPARPAVYPSLAELSRPATEAEPEEGKPEEGLEETIILRRTAPKKLR